MGIKKLGSSSGVIRRRPANDARPASPRAALAMELLPLESEPEPEPAPIEPSEQIVVYDLVCGAEGRIKSGLSLEACLTAAREHNAMPGHDADCVPRRRSPR